jgi:hypothetical protein
VPGRRRAEAERIYRTLPSTGPLTPMFSMGLALRPEWPDRAALEDALATTEGQGMYLNLVWSLAAERRGLVLGPSDAYHFAPPPALGGEYAVENIQVASIRIVLSLAGQLHGV